MVTRLEVAYLSEHTIVPVMMISSFGYRKARILQAHFDHGHLIILKSKLYDFSTLEQFNQIVDLFTLYLSSDCVGHTMVVDASWITERPEQQKPDFNVGFVNGKRAYGVLVLLFLLFFSIWCKNSGIGLIIMTVVHLLTEK